MPLLDSASQWIQPLSRFPIVPRVYNARARQRFQHFSSDAPTAVHKPKPLERVRGVGKLRHLSNRTEQAYADWIRAYLSEVMSMEKRYFTSDLSSLS